MANPPKLDKLITELENRLDELFRENGPAPTDSPARKAKSKSGVFVAFGVDGPAG